MCLRSVLESEEFGPITRFIGDGNRVSTSHKQEEQKG